MPTPNDPRLANPTLLALAALRLKQRKSSGIIVAYRADHESSAQAIRRTLGRAPHDWEVCLVVEYEPALPDDDACN